MGMPFIVDNGIVIEMNWDQMAMMSLAMTGIYTTRLLLDENTLIEQVRSSTKKLEELKGH